MDEQWVEVGNIPCPMIVRWNGVVVMVSFIEGLFKAPKKGGHGEVHVAVSIVDRGVDEHRAAFGVAKEVTRPQIAMKKGRRLRREVIGKTAVEILQSLNGDFVQQTPIGGKSDLGLQAAVNKELYPIGGRGIILGKRAYVIVLGKARGRRGKAGGRHGKAGRRRGKTKARRSLAVQRRQLFPKEAPEPPGPVSLVDPLENEQLMTIGLDMGKSLRDTNDALPAQYGQTLSLR